MIGTEIMDIGHLEGAMLPLGSQSRFLWDRLWLFLVPYFVPPGILGVHNSLLGLRLTLSMIQALVTKYFALQYLLCGYLYHSVAGCYVRCVLPLAKDICTGVREQPVSAGQVCFGVG